MRWLQKGLCHMSATLPRQCWSELFTEKLIVSLPDFHRPHTMSGGETRRAGDKLNARLTRGILLYQICYQTHSIWRSTSYHDRKYDKIILRPSHISLFIRRRCRRRSNTIFFIYSIKSQRRCETEKKKSSST